MNSLICEVWKNKTKQKTKPTNKTELSHWYRVQTNGLSEGEGVGEEWNKVWENEEAKNSHHRVNKSREWKV